MTFANTTSPLHAFVLLARGRSGINYQEVVEASNLKDVRYRPIGGHHAFLAVRPGKTLTEAAQYAEYDIVSSLPESFWILLCPTCELPLGLSANGYTCTAHGVMLGHDLSEEAPVEELIPARRKPSRHRRRSAHKREAMGAAWARFLTENQNKHVTFPHLVDNGLPEARPGETTQTFSEIREELAEMLKQASSERIVTGW